MVLRELARVAFADLRSIYRPDGSLMSVSELSDDAAASVAGVESTEVGDGTGYIRKLKRWDKVKALELLGKHLGMYTDKVALSGDVSIPPLIQIAFVDASQKSGSDVADKKTLP
jgi:phage terminase small subunit